MRHKQPAGFTPPPGMTPPHPEDEPDEPLDEALRESFPASDPIAVNGSGHPHGNKRQADVKKSGAGP